MSSDKRLRRAYYRAAFEKRAKQQVREALSGLENRCLPPRRAPSGTDDLHRAMMQITWWPSANVLAELDSSVKALAMLDREKVPRPLWKAFEHVNKRWRGFRLINRLNALVLRARKLLEEAGESDLTRVRREADGSGERAMEAKGFLADLRRIKRNSKEAAKIAWQDYEPFLFKLRGIKPVQLACGDLPASPRVMCYARALEIIVDDELREPLRYKARPLLEWIARVNNPAYSDVLKWDDFMKCMAQGLAGDAVEEHAERKRKQARERQRRFRARKITR